MVQTVKFFSNKLNLLPTFSVFMMYAHCLLSGESNYNC